MRAPRESGNGRDARFEAIFRKHYARIWRYFRANSVSDDESHDLTQDTFLRFHRYMDDMRKDDDDGCSFLYTIARTIMLNRVRYEHARRRSGKMVDIDADDSFDLPDTKQREADEELHLKRQRQDLYRAINELSGTQREGMLLWLGGSTYEEIAAVLRISIDAVKSRLRDAKRFLRMRLGSDVALPEDEQ